MQYTEICREYWFVSVDRWKHDGYDHKVIMGHMHTNIHKRGLDMDTGLILWDNH